MRFTEKQTTGKVKERYCCFAMNRGKILNCCCENYIAPEKETMAVLRLLLFIVFSFGLFSATAVAEFSPGTTIQHQKAAYFAGNKRLPLTAQFDDKEGIIEVRCYFRAGADTNFLYILMNHQSGRTYQCSLPAFKPGSQSLQYFFLVVNGRKQVIRTTFFAASEAGTNTFAQEQDDQAPKHIQLYSELGDSLLLKNTSISDSLAKIVPTQHSSEMYGLRSGVYKKEVIPESLNSMPGYFGGFILDNATGIISPVKGFAPNLIKPSTRNNKISANVLEDLPSVQAVTGETINIKGNNWSGYFTRTDRLNNKTIITNASITQVGSQVEITTSLTGLGHFLSGTMNDTGDMLLYDSYDGEDWTTHNGPATSLEINIYDYIWPPQVGEPEPPLNVIVLHRTAIVEPPPIISPILELLL